MVRHYMTMLVQLTDEDAWWCPHCNSAQRGATKTLGLFSVPEVLLLHLKRFKQVSYLFHVRLLKQKKVFIFYKHLLFCDT